MTEPQADSVVVDPHGRGRWNDLSRSMSEFLEAVESGIGEAAVGEPDPERVAQLMTAVGSVRAVESFTAWAQYEAIAALHTELVASQPADYRLLDAHAELGARIAMFGALTQTMGERLVDEAVALRDRLPQVALCLRDGVITKLHVATVVSRTELIEDAEDAEAVDAEIAATLRRRKGGWSRSRLRDMCDRIVFRRDPDSVRRRRQQAHEDRGVWLDTDREHGMAALCGTMSAENARIAFESVKSLAACACKADPRRVAARRSDAMFALLTGQRFACECGLAECPAVIPEARSLPDSQARIVIHVVCDESTLDGSADNPAFMDGYGVTGADHVRDIAGQDHTWIRPLVPGATKSGGSGTESAQGRRAQRTTREAAQRGPAAGGDVGNDSRRFTPGPVGADETVYAGPPSECADAPVSGDDVISADSADSADRADQTARTGGAVDAAGSPDFDAVPAGGPLPSHLPSDPYRPSRALDTFVRIRDGYCTVLGCEAPAWSVDLDHVTEYDHQHPERGGRTEPLGLNGKCRFHHLLKSFSHWVDDQFLGPDGHTIRVWYTPEGVRIAGPPEDNTALFPGLKRVRFAVPATGSLRELIDQPMRERTRTAAKHARRRHERELNRADRAVGPGYRPAHPSVDFTDYGPPPF
ncbi:DUF222 domain-containing protein [Gordonia amarae]|nr:DUF222 domain-containing protein [Gordonia amarae]